MSSSSEKWIGQDWNTYFRHFMWYFFPLFSLACVRIFSFLFSLRAWAKTISFPSTYSTHWWHVNLSWLPGTWYEHEHTYIFLQFHRLFFTIFFFFAVRKFITKEEWVKINVRLFTNRLHNRSNVSLPHSSALSWIYPLRSGGFYKFIVRVILKYK